MRIFVSLFIISIFLTGCTLTNNGKMNFDLVVNVDVAEDIIKGSVGIGLPLALEQFDQDKIKEHATQVSVATSAALNILGDTSKPLSQQDVNNLLSAIDKDLTAPERYAIQSAIDLIISLIRKEVRPEQYLTKDVRNILVFFLKEVNNVYSLYATSATVKGMEAATLTYKP